MPQGKEPHTIFARPEARSAGGEQRLPTWWANLTHDSVCEAYYPMGLGGTRNASEASVERWNPDFQGEELTRGKIVEWTTLNGHLSSLDSSALFKSPFIWNVNVCSG